MILAAIDIGSNAIRLQIIRVIKQGEKLSFKKLEYLRFPLRLGKDAFGKGAIQKPTIEKFEKLMRTFKLLIELYDVDDYIATATSAMREAVNGATIVQRIATFYDLKIDIISGEDEAAILSNAILPYLDNKNYVHIGVMKIMGADQILVPKVGLKDGLLYTLYENVTGESIKEIEFIESF